MSQSPNSESFRHPVRIIEFIANNEMVANFAGLNDIFNKPEIQDRKVVIISLIGAFREGKSFFLDYCLRFLYAHVSDDN